MTTIYVKSTHNVPGQLQLVQIAWVSQNGEGLIEKAQTEWERQKPGIPGSVIELCTFDQDEYESF